MYVLHIGTERGWRGGENQIRLLIEGLESHGIRNSLAYPKGSRALAHFKGKIPTVSLSSSNPFHPFSIRQLMQYCRRHQVDIIDAHSSKAHQLGIILKTFMPHLKLVVHRRVDNPPSSSWWTKKRYHSSKVDHYVVISEKIGEILTNYGVPSTKMSLVYSAIDIDKYRSISRQKERESLLARLGLPADSFLLGNASALTAQKGYETLIDALALLKNSNSWQAIIAGEGELLPSLKRRAQAHGVDNRVHFIGFIDLVPHFLSGVDLVCVPSNNEGLGTLILDAMAAGTPVVATSVGGIPEIITSEHNGVLVNRGDHQALAHAIAELMENQEKRQHLSLEAYERLGERFSLQAMVSGNKEAYESL